MKRTIQITDFRFTPSSYGQYRVTYTSPSTGMSWTQWVNDMQIIDATKNSDTPKQKYLMQLKRICKTCKR